MKYQPDSIGTGEGRIIEDIGDIRTHTLSHQNDIFETDLITDREKIIKELLKINDLIYKIKPL
jgi:hypothetical protein